MGQRGRKSAAEAGVGALVPSTVTPRLAAPASLGEAERALWVEVVNDQPAGAFTVTHAPMLELYCRHITQARILAMALADFPAELLAADDGLKRYDKLLAMQEREGRAASSLATRLRITRQAVDHPTTAGRALKNATTARKPWESSDDD